MTTQPSMLLKVHELALEFRGAGRVVRALDGASLQVHRGEALGIVGESGSGKSTLGFALSRLLPETAHYASGHILFAEQDMVALPLSRLRSLREQDIRYVFQDPVSTLDPTMRIGDQIRQAFTLPADTDTCYAALADVGLHDPARISQSWPHELSGGMAQRVVIAMALLGKPQLLIADEATSALDASVRERVLQLMRERCQQRDMTLLLLSHDLMSVRKFTDRIAVVYAGRVIESGPTAAVFARPAHPYTRALLAASPGHERPGDLLGTIEGMPPVLHGRSTACSFAPRCPHAQPTCQNERPELQSVQAGWDTLCTRWHAVCEGNQA